MDGFDCGGEAHDMSLATGSNYLPNLVSYLKSVTINNYMYMYCLETTAIRPIIFNYSTN